MNVQPVRVPARGTVRDLPAAGDSVVHHWVQGPQDLTPLVPPDTSHDPPFTHEFRWALDRAAGTDRATAAAAVTAVLTDPRGWGRAGVRYVQVSDPAQAHILVRVIPADTTACGRGAAGCYSWGGSGPPVAEIGVEYLGQVGVWDELVNMELGGHGTFRMLDMYTPAHQTRPYDGCMGTWNDAAKTSYYPSEQEIRSARQWLHGHAERVHDEMGGPETGVPPHSEPWDEPPQPPPASDWKTRAHAAVGTAWAKYAVMANPRSTRRRYGLEALAAADAAIDAAE